MNLPKLDQFRRVVVKVGSSLLVDRARGAARREWLEGLADDLAALHRRGADVLVVSSGAVALGRSVLGLPSGPLIILVAGGFYLVSLVLGRTGGLLRDRARSRHLEA